MKLRNMFQTYKAEKLTAILFLLLIFLMLCGLLSNGWKLTGDFLTDYRNTVKPGTPVIGRITGAIDSMERTIDNDTYKREKYIDFYGMLQKFMDKKVIVDIGYGDLYKTKYGQITYAVPKQDVSTHLENMYNFKRELAKHDIPLLYVQAPFKLREGEQQLPNNVKDHSNENVDRFLKGLDAGGIDYLDLRKNYWNKGLNQNQLFFNTDHHWTINGAFLGYQELVKTLNTSYGFSIDKKFTDLANFDQKVYKNYYIGSMGRRVGESYGGIDDFTLITPKFDTDYTIYERDYGGEKVYQGNFQDALLTNSYLAPGTPPETNRYAAYHGDNAELQFINHKIKNGKVLIIKDSFGLPIYSFLSTGVHEVRALDVRLFTGSVIEYAEKYHPDIVLVLYNGDCFGGDMFRFNAK